MPRAKKSPKKTRRSPETTSGLGHMAEWRIVSDYLASLDAKTRYTKRFRNPEEQLEKVVETLAETTDPIVRLELVQRKMDIERFIEESQVDPSAQYRAKFVEVASSYGDRKGISYAAWREVGVPAAVLKEAGITNGRE